MPPRPGDPVPPHSYDPEPSQTSVRTRALLASAIGAVFGLFVYVAQAPAPRALGAGLVIAAGVFFLLRSMDLIRIEWPPPPNGWAVRLARIPRWQLNGFDALTEARPGLSQSLRSRLRVLATAILVRHDLTPGSPGAISLLGAGTHELLFRPHQVGADPPPPDPSAAQITAMIDRLIVLGDTRGPAGAGTTPPPAKPSPQARTMETEGNR